MSYRKNVLFWLFVAAIIVVSAHVTMAQSYSPTPKQDINAVLAAHDKELLAIPNVVGVYVGLLEDGKTPCLKVMLAQPSAEAEGKIPRSIDGYPVVTAVTGKIRPMDH